MCITFIDRQPQNTVSISGFSFRLSRVCVCVCHKMCASTTTELKQGKYKHTDGTLTYAEFSNDIEAIIRISNEIFDNWQLKRVTQNDGIEHSYLTKSETKFIELEDMTEPSSCSFVYHVVYHQSYQVPCLGFNVYRLGKFAKHL